MVHEAVAGIGFEEEDQPTPPGGRELWLASDEEKD